MALQKLIPLPSGVSVEYARIQSLLYDREQRIVQVQVVAFLDGAYAQAGAQPVGNIATVTIQGDEAEMLVAALHDICGPLVYPAVKATDLFAGAVDV